MSEHKRRIVLSPEAFGLARETDILRRTEPGRDINHAVLQVLDGLGIGPRADTLFAGQRIAQYELIRELGRGAMGRVFLARDTRLGRLVAIKFLDAVHLSDRFLVEARATANCTHENIVVIHDVGEHQGLPYMVLEYLKGQPLGQVMEGQALSARRAVELMVPVVRALVHAHEFGIVHRDLKPDNIIVTDAGTIKVLDFGIAKLVSRPGATSDAADPAAASLDDDLFLTQDGMVLGTMPYMSPEQWRGRSQADEDSEVDHRSDLWAAGIILYEMVCGRHPLAPVTRESLATIADLDAPMPGVDAGVSTALSRVIEACLKKRKAERIASASELLDELESILGQGRRLRQGESPYAGLTPFQEQDAHRFFGRSRDIVRMTGRLKHQPLVAVVGPTGVGKSSFIRAGVVPALKRSGEAWEVFIVRPGRHPVGSLASMVESMGSTGRAITAPDRAAVEHRDLYERLHGEPGYLGALLRARARAQNAQILIFVDQFEELYTLVPDARDRLAFTACLAGVADDASAPLRVIVSMRSDFLDRVAEDREFMDQIMNALMFLSQPSRRSLATALVQPAEMAGCRFEDPDMVADMLDALEKSPAPLPLLQFTAARLWDVRDHERRLLTRQSYEELGGVAGALASHADDVLTSLPAPSQALARAIFERLVTPERTRAIASLDDLCQLSADPDSTRELIDRLARARLLVVQNDSSGKREAEGKGPAPEARREATIEPTVEIVHESLIEGWPTLRRWLDEDHEKAAFLAELRVAAKQWEAKGRPQGLLWRGEAMTEARHWHARLAGELSGRERAFLDEVLWLANRSARRWRIGFAVAFAVLLALVAAAAVGLLWIGNAERLATEQALLAQQEAIRARDAEKRISEHVEELKKANAGAEAANIEVKRREAELEEANDRLEQALAQAREAKTQAENQSRLAHQAAEEARLAGARAGELAAAERKAREELEKALRKEKDRVERLKAEIGIHSRDLK